MAGLAASLKVPSEEVPDRVEQLVLKLKEAEKAVESLRAEQARAAVADLVDQGVTVGDTLVVAARIADGVDANGLRGLVTDLRGRIADRNAVVALFSAADGKVPFAIGTTDAARGSGVKAGDLVREIAPLVSGRGGGKPDLAQGSGTDAAGIDAALARLREVIGAR